MSHWGGSSMPRGDPAGLFLTTMDDCHPGPGMKEVALQTTFLGHTAQMKNKLLSPWPLPWVWESWLRLSPEGRGESQPRGPASSANTQAHILGLGLSHPNIYPICDQLECVKGTGPTEP